jgi:alkanesulfonate monooxygenase SsuD/methylene tetrahydromethanopterin reductase-like flavin-dependent oxidoreductase (luciferase family)
VVQLGFSIDPRQELSEADELGVVQLGADLGYQSAWTPSGPDSAAFDRCLRWHQATGLATGISVVPASGQPAAFYAEHAQRVWEGTGGSFVFGVGSGRLEHAAQAMRPYLEDIRSRLPEGQPIHLAALGPVMLRLAGEAADGVLLNWCSPEMVTWSRDRVDAAAADAGRPNPVVGSYIRTSVDPDGDLARRTLAESALQYALGPVAYRRHFERMGFGDELARLEADRGQMPNDAFLADAGAAGTPGDVRARFQRLAGGLDVAVVRVLVTTPGDAESARRVLQECRPPPAE